MSFFFLEARYDLVLQARFISGVENSLADAISKIYSVICTHRFAAH